MKLHVWKTVSGLFFTVAVAAVGGGSTGAELGCSTTASGTGSSSGGRAAAAAASRPRRAAPTTLGQLHRWRGRLLVRRGRQPQGRGPEPLLQHADDERQAGPLLLLHGRYRELDDLLAGRHADGGLPGSDVVRLRLRRRRRPDDVRRLARLQHPDARRRRRPRRLLLHLRGQQQQQQRRHGPRRLHPRHDARLRRRRDGYACAIGDNPENEDASPAARRSSPPARTTTAATRAARGARRPASRTTR